ncbi:MAG: acyltransferase [Myxococcota bacterium]
MISHTQYRSRRTFSGLDGLRALCVIAVVWHHAGARTPLPITSNGFLGVDVFFALSGFLIVTLLLRERDRHGTISLRDFYMRRTLRIFPLYYGVVGGLLLLHALVPRTTTQYAVDYAPYLFTYTSDLVVVPGALAVGWSLAAEEQFYLVWPTIERFGARAWWLLGAIGIGVSQCFNFGLFPNYGLEILQTTFTPILLGVGLAHALHDPKTFARLAPWLRSPVLRGLTVVTVLVLANTPGDVAGLPRLAFHLAITGLVAVVVTRKDGATSVLDAWVLRRIGAVSYGIYLLHMFVMTAVTKAVPGPAFGTFVMVMVGTWGAAELSYRFYERRFINLKHRFAR